MNDLFNELRGLLGDLWRTGNYWLRLGVLALTVWPLFLIILATAGLSGTAIATLAVVVPVVALGIILLKWPLVTVFASSDKDGRRVLGVIFTIAFMELGVGIFLALVPVSDSPGLVPIFVLVAVALGLLTLARMTLGKEKFKWTRRLLILVLAVMTLNFLGSSEVVAGVLENTSTQAVALDNVLVVEKISEEVLHFREDQDLVELPLPVDGSYTPWVALPLDTTGYRLATRSDDGYVMCVRDKGCFTSNPGDDNVLDFDDAEDAVFRFQGLKAGTSILVRVTR